MKLRYIMTGLLLGSLAGASNAGEAPAQPTVPIDPFDYSFCGGKPVYPVVGFNFATYCGPRNQIGIGRRGKLMWIYPKQDGSGPHASGARQLSTEELARLTLLAEVAQLAGHSEYAPHSVVYDMGINFSGRPYKRVHGTLALSGSSANALFEAMRAMVPDQPLLPDCENAPADFNPTLVPEDRRRADTAATETAHGL